MGGGLWVDRERTRTDRRVGGGIRTDEEQTGADKEAESGRRGSGLGGGFAI